MKFPVLLLIIMMGSLVSAEGIKSNTEECKDRIKFLGSMIEVYCIKSEEYPGRLEDIYPLLQELNLNRDVLFDPWGGFLQYKRVKSKNGSLTFALRSVGKDKKAGTKDDISHLICGWK